MQVFLFKVEVLIYLQVSFMIQCQLFLSYLFPFLILLTFYWVILLSLLILAIFHITNQIYLLNHHIKILSFHNFVYIYFLQLIWHILRYYFKTMSMNSSLEFSRMVIFIETYLKSYFYFNFLLLNSMLLYFRIYYFFVDFYFLIFLLFIKHLPPIQNI